MLELVSNNNPATLPQPSVRHPAENRHALTCRQLSLSVSGKTLIDQVDLTFDRNLVTVLLGFNGAGKSLLLRLLHGLLTPTAGAVLWNNRPCNLAIRKKQAMVFQKPVLLRRSVIDNIRFVLQNAGIRDRLRAEQLLEQIGLLPFATRPARRLSGGEQQRLALGRALATEPDILFLDEATASLDPASVLVIEQIIQAVSRNGTKVVMVTHDLGQARRLAGEIVFINDGRVTEQACARQFFQRPQTPAGRAFLNGQLPTSTLRESHDPQHDYLA